MIASLSLILLCQLAGEVFVRGLGFPIPGPVIGLMLLLGLLLARDRFAVLGRGPLQGDGVEQASRVIWPICRCSLFPPVSASCKSSISLPNMASLFWPCLRSR